VSNPFLGQISLVAFTFPPRGFATCDGQLLSIQQNTALFSLLGTTYGGNGTTNFGLPNLQGRAPVHRSPTLAQGESAGELTHTLIAAEMPAHSHSLMGSTAAATSTTPAGNVLASKAATRGASLYAPAPATEALALSAIGLAGGGQPHTNVQPMLTMLFVIALQGIFPARN
jgi:microcystin-dependent protein